MKVEFVLGLKTAQQILDTPNPYTAKTLGSLVKPSTRNPRREGILKTPNKGKVYSKILSTSGVTFDRAKQVSWMHCRLVPGSGCTVESTELDDSTYRDRGDIFQELRVEIRDGFQSKHRYHLKQYNSQNWNWNFNQGFLATHVTLYCIPGCIFQFTNLPPVTGLVWLILSPRLFDEEQAWQKRKKVVWPGADRVRGMQVFNGHLVLHGTSRDFEIWPPWTADEIWYPTHALAQKWSSQNQTSRSASACPRGMATQRGSVYVYPFNIHIWLHL